MADQVLTAASERHREVFEELVAEVAAYNPDVDRDLLERAFEFASARHEGQQRRSGEDFILHPLGVARILAELGRDDTTLAAALVHDVVEDTQATVEEVRAEFGEEVANLVEGVTKLTRIQFQSREQAQAIFAELGLDEDPDGRRHLVESQTFCELLHEPVPLAA